MFRGFSYGEFIVKHTRSDMNEIERRIVMYEGMMLFSLLIGDAKGYVKNLDYYLHYRERAGL